MIDLGEDLTEKLLHGYSWHITSEKYDIANRVFYFQVIKSLEEPNIIRELRWKGIRNIEITIEESDIDDKCIDSIIGIQQRRIDNHYHVYIQTDKHGIGFISECEVETHDS